MVIFMAEKETEEEKGTKEDKKERADLESLKERADMETLKDRVDKLEDIVEKGVKVPSILVGMEYIRFDKEDPFRTIEYIRDYFEQLKLRKEQNARFGLGLAALLLGLVILASD